MLTLTRGYLSLQNNDVCVSAERYDHSFRFNKSETTPHITVFTKSEMQQIKHHTSYCESTFADGLQKCDTYYVDLGLGCSDSVYYKVILWYAGNELRKKYGLQEKHFHITLSKNDNHDICKDYTTIVQQLPLTERDIRYITDHLVQVKDIKLLHYFYSIAPSEKLCNMLSLSISELVHICKSHKTWCSPYLKLAAHFTALHEYKHAMICFTIALHKCKSNENVKVVDKITSHVNLKLCELSLYTTWGYLFTEDEYHLYLDSPFKDFLSECVEFLSNEPVVDIPINDFMIGTETHKFFSLQSRIRHFTIDDYRSMRFLRWMIPYNLAISSTPRSADDVYFLKEKLNIDVVVTLTVEEPLLKEWFVGGIQNVFMPVDNYKAPNIAQVEQFIDIVTSGKRTLVHCGGGVGRAGTMLCCYILACGFTTSRLEYPAYSAGQIITLIRQMRPGSIETDEQERFIATFEKYLWNNLTANKNDKALDEPETDLKIVGTFDSNSPLIICCGLQGSGKSTFSESIAEKGYVHICQDLIGGKSDFTNYYMSTIKKNKKIVVDKCNVTKSSRKELFELAFSPKDTICVYFDVDKDLCIQRADARLDHPTIAYGRSSLAITKTAKMLEPPTLSEGFACVVKVSSRKACQQLLGKFGIHVGKNNAVNDQQEQKQEQEQDHQDQQDQEDNDNLFRLDLVKFPRTRHLYNFGSATRDDLLLSDTQRKTFYNCEEDGKIVIEEKIDGANMGITIDCDTANFKVQNRSHFVNSKSHAQFAKLDHWLQQRNDDLWHILTLGETTHPSKLILYGEWVVAKHSIHYTNLPDTFIAFDLYDRDANIFYSREKLSELLKFTNIKMIRLIKTVTGKDIKKLDEKYFKLLMNEKSIYYDGLVEGVYVRRENKKYSLDRSKVVRTDFISGNEHWSKGSITKNIVL